MDALRPLSLDQFAAMTAEIDAGFPRDRVLLDASISAEQWELTQETWLLRMAKQGAQRKLALVDRYNELLAKHRKSAQRKMRAEKRKHKGPMPVAPEAHLSPLARASNPDGSGATFQQPGFAGAPERASFAAAAGPNFAPDVRPTAPSGWSPDQPAFAAQVPANVPPFVAAQTPAHAPPFVAEPPALEPSAAARMKRGGTMVNMNAADLAAMMGPAWLGKNPQAPSPQAQPVAGLPFQAKTAQPQAPSPQAPSPQAQPVAGLPFQAKAAQPQAPSPQAPSPQAQPVAGLPFQAHVASTTPPKASPPTGGLPFQAQAASKPAVAPQVPANATPFQSANAQPAPSAQAASGGLPFQPSAPNAPKASGPAAGLPFQTSTQPAGRAPTGNHAAAHAPAAQPPATHAPTGQQPAAQQPATHAQTGQQPAATRLTVEQLAWLQAQSETSPDLARGAREKLGMSEADVVRERAAWQTRFQHDRAILERYSQVFYHYRRGPGSP